MKAFHGMPVILFITESFARGFNQRGGRRRIGLELQFLLHAEVLDDVALAVGCVLAHVESQDAAGPPGAVIEESQQHPPNQREDRPESHVQDQGGDRTHKELVLG
jgi:hypothetical protein